MWRLVLLGAPGVGVSTQAELLFNALGACPLSAGDIFRAINGLRTVPGSAMAAAQEQMARGEPVSDDTVLGLIRERSRCLRCGGGFMLDGFPRTLTQARALDALLSADSLQLDAVISYDLPAEEITARLSGRRVCPKCTAAFHIRGHRPRISGICDQCDTALVQQPEDQPAAIGGRLSAYAAATGPVVEHYRTQNLLISIPANGKPVEVLARTLDALVALVAVESTA